MTGRELDDRGLSFTTMIVAMMPVFVVVSGLVVDGAAQASATRHATVVAAQAARTGADASAASRLSGRSGDDPALSAARAALSARGAQGLVDVEHGRLHVRVDEGVDTVFLGIVGIRRLRAHADVWADLTRE